MKKNIWLDGMMGLVVGDALGSPVQFMQRNEVMSRGLVTGMEDGGAFNTPAGTWTDDSSMALALLSSIVDKKCIDLVDIMERFASWLKEGEYTPFGYAFDIGITCEQAISSFIRNRDVNTCGRTGEYANGNGSLMRIMPACIYYYIKEMNEEISESDAVDGVIKIASLTHNHLRTNMSNGLYYFMVKSILENKNEENSLSFFDILNEGILRGYKFFENKIENKAELANFDRLLNLNKFKDTAPNDIESSGYVIHTIEAAVWSLINTDSFKDALLKAVNLGDDADTVGAVAGGLAGLYYGYDNIPSEWLDVIKRRNWIEDMCNKM